MRTKTVLSNAMFAKLSAAGFDAFITTQGGAAVSNEPVRKSIEEIAREVLLGKWGNGEERKNRLKAAGYDYETVRKKVNELA